MKIQNGINTAAQIANASTASTVDALVELQQEPVKKAEKQKQKLLTEKNGFQSLENILGQFGQTLNALKSPSDFTKLKVESSHPEIVEGQITGPALIGSYEMEVRDLAQKDRMLDIGFKDANHSPVGFGFMAFEDVSGEIQELKVDPGSTLKDVAQKINEQLKGLHAQIIETGLGEDPVKLLVSSENTGELAQIHIDPDTTFFEFDKIKEGRNLSMDLEGVPISRTENKINDLIDGIMLTAKQAAPGSKVTINIDHDLDETKKGILNFAQQYNNIIKSTQGMALGSEQQENNNSLELDTTSPLAGLVNNSLLKSVKRRLQSEITNPGSFSGSKFKTLAEIGMTTNPKTGELIVNEQKLQQALENDFEGVREVFVHSEKGDGLANKLAKTVHSFQGSQGILQNKKQSLDRLMKDKEAEIEQKARFSQQSSERIRKQFQALEGHMAQMQNQNQFLASSLKTSSEG